MQINLETIVAALTIIVSIITSVYHLWLLFEKYLKRLIVNQLNLSFEQRAELYKNKIKDETDAIFEEYYYPFNLKQEIQELDKQFIEVKEINKNLNDKINDKINKFLNDNK
jgi:hypothetical protein